MSDYVKIGSESTYGGGATTTNGVLTTDINEDIDRGLMTEETNDTSLPRLAVAGALKVSGSIDASVRPIQMRPFFKALMGAEELDTTEHTATYTFDEPESMQLSIGESIAGTSTQKDYVGVGIKSVNLKFDAREFVKATFNWLAKSYSDGTYAKPTFSDENPIVFYRACVKVNDTQTYNIKSMTMDIDRKLNEDNFVLGSFLQRRLATTGNTETSGSITFVEEDFDEYNRANYGSTGATSVPESNDTGSISLVVECVDLAVNAAMTITSPIAIYSKSSKKSSGRSEVEKTVDYTVTTGSTPFSIVINDAAITV